ncbi:hypothetical protein J8J14_20805 [Roseomonas sp. SSH11]|uniref:Uncharacterized protein n=1 Tax=Pararoseomonas baculiformis TaxID=2820812 RepID=A0ABS4AL46_9PROT|nr:hypothetical protein [Pararoseomonas baculiformis]MBP0447218.1 hypothetical protein [Pararoseomonas baculiformis]
MADLTTTDTPVHAVNQHAKRIRKVRRTEGIVDADAELGLAVVKLLQANPAITRDMLVRRFTRQRDNSEEGSLDRQEAEAVLVRLETGP